MTAVLVNNASGIKGCVTGKLREAQPFTSEVDKLEFTAGFLEEVGHTRLHFGEVKRRE